ncbi:MAG: hypothetical protein AAFZ58_03635 [Pseudomonadota bacterium]
MLDAAAAQGLLEQYAAAWAANDPSALALFWDQNEPRPFYKAEEVEHFFHSAVDIAAYWQHNAQFHDAIQLSFSHTHAQSLNDGRTLVITRMRWDIRFAGDAKNADGSPFASAGKAMGGENHVLAIVRATANGPKLIGWSETPDAPISYMRRLYEWSARPLP